MGLDTTHDCWHGAYSAFMRWRREIAKTAGIPLMLMQGFYAPPDEDAMLRTAPRAIAFSREEYTGGFVVTKHSLETALADTAERGDAGRLHDWITKILPSLPVSWDILADDPIVILLNHSDCDGHIEWEDCTPLADRLEELIPLLPDKDFGGHVGWIREKTKQFVAGLRKAASLQQPVLFH